MANIFWVLGTGTWDASSTAHWSASTGGSAGAGPPGATDTAVFDTNSGGGASTISGANPIGGLSLAGTTSLSGSIEVDGNVVLSSTNNISGLSITHASGVNNYTSNGGAAATLTLTGGTITLQDAFSLQSTLTISGGTFTANNKAVGINNSMIASGSTTRTINMGTNTWTIQGTSGTVWDTSGTNITVNASTSTIDLSGDGNKTFAAGTSQTFNNLQNEFTSNHTLTLTYTTAITFADFKQTSPTASAITFPASTTMNVTTFTVSGASATKLITLQSSSPGTAFTLSDTTGTNTCYNLSIQDSTATGGAVWQALYSTNVSGNTGWVFKTNLSGMFLAF